MDDVSTPAAFHANCDQFDETVTIARHGPVPQTDAHGSASPNWVDGADWVFGGYAEHTWAGSDGWDTTATGNFIFGLEPGTPERHNPTTPNHYQMLSPDYWPTWGAGTDLTMGANGFSGGDGPSGSGGYCDQGGTYSGSNSQICGGNRNWGTTELQVWRRRV